jgi:hypothetical protein
VAVSQEAGTPEEAGGRHVGEAGEAAEAVVKQPPIVVWKTCIFDFFFLLLIITCDVSDFFFLSFLSQLKLKLTVA